MYSSRKSIKNNFKKISFNHYYKVLFEPFNFYSEQFFLSLIVSMIFAGKKKTDFFQRDISPPTLLDVNGLNLNQVLELRSINYVCVKIELGMFQNNTKHSHFN